jgi:hypothetical protein
MTKTIVTATMMSKIVNLSPGGILPGNGEPGVMSAAAGLLHSELTSCNVRKREATGKPEVMPPGWQIAPDKR